MSITASYRRLTPDEFQRSLIDPKVAADFGLFDMENDLDDESGFEKSDRYRDIGRYWHALHFLLTGKAELDTTEVPPPLGNVVLGGTETKWEATYGMVRSLTPEEVRDVASALEGIELEDLRRLDLTAFGAANLYSCRGNWSAEDLEMLLEVFAEVRDFFSEAAREGDVMLLSSN